MTTNLGSSLRPGRPFRLAEAPTWLTRSTALSYGFGPLLQVPAPAAQLTKVLAGLRHTFVVADATLPDCPLVYASEG